MAPRPIILPKSAYLNNAAHRPPFTEVVIRVVCIVCITVKRKTITIREDQDEWIENQHLNLSSFVREQLDELIEERGE
ncbi:MAG: hypothetical protein ABEJ73_12935, partial [Haloplanus sp.]